MQAMILALHNQRVRASLRILLAWILAPALSSPSSAQEPPLDLLRPGDAIRLQLSVGGEEQGYDGEYMVDEAGVLSLPLIGSMRAIDVPSAQLRQRIIDHYESMFRNQAIQVTILRRISVMGAVKSPGLYLVDPTMRISDVIAEAGGANEDGRVNEARILRNGQELRVELAPQSPLPAELRSGDQLFIPEKSWLARNGDWVVGVTVGTIGMLIRLSR